jgi:hypothetical protein
VQLVDFVVLGLALVVVEGVVFGQVGGVVVAEAVFHAGDDRVEVLDVRVLVFGEVDRLDGVYLFGVHEEVGDLFAQFGGDGDGDDGCEFGLDEQFAFSSLEEADVGHVESEVDFMVDTGEQLEELLHFEGVDFEHGAGLAQELLALLFYLVVLEADVAETVLALFWGGVEVSDVVL